MVVVLLKPGVSCLLTETSLVTVLFPIKRALSLSRLCLSVSVSAQPPLTPDTPTPTGVAQLPSCSSDWKDISKQKLKA